MIPVGNGNSIASLFLTASEKTHWSRLGSRKVGTEITLIVNKVMSVWDGQRLFILT